MRILTIITLLTILSACHIKSEIDKAHEIVEKGLSQTKEPIAPNHKALTNTDSLVHALLTKIKESHPDNIYDMSLNAVSVCKRIEQQTDGIINAIQTAHTLDEQGELNDRRNAKYVNEIMIKQDVGRSLHKTLKQSSQILSIAARSLDADPKYVVQISTGQQDIPPNTSWWEYNFMDMPGQAALPILRKLNKDAHETKIRFLKHVSEMNR